MSIDYTGFKYAKARPRALDQKDRKNVIVSTDKAEDKNVKQRSGAQCEIVVIGEGRCARRAVQIHHLLGGWGRRARGRSALSEHKQHCCVPCHQQITSHILRLNATHGDLPQWNDRYTRVK
jgi:hypothetical protein